MVRLTNYLTDTHNILAEEGLKVIVCVDAPEGVEPYYTLYQYDRTTGVAVILVIFLLLMLLVGGEKGFSAALALAFSMVFLIRVTIPAIYQGGSPVGAGAGGSVDCNGGNDLPVVWLFGPRRLGYRRNSGRVNAYPVCCSCCFPRYCI